MCVNVHGTRTFFGGVFEKPVRDLKQPLLDPGMEKMLELDKRIHLIARLPPGEELVVALRAFVNAKYSKRAGFEDFHAVQVLQTVESLEGRNPESGEPWLTVQDLSLLLRVIANGRVKLTEVHNALAKTAYRALQQRIPQPDTRTWTEKMGLLQNYVAILCRTGDSKEARDVLEAYWEQNAVEKEEDRDPWPYVLKGFSHEKNEVEILRTIEMMKKFSILATQHAYRALATHYALKDDVEQTRRWVDEANENGVGLGDLAQKNNAYRILLEFCLRNQEMEWGVAILEADAQSSKSKQRVWSATLQAAAGTGKSVDEVDRMLEVLVRRSTDGDKGPSTTTLNALINFAVTKNDPYMAERYYGLLDKWNATPNAQSYILQIEYRLQAGDIEGAKATYAKLREEKISNNEDWDIMNKLVCAMAQSSRPNNEAIMGLVDDLSERHIVFPAETVSVLCHYHLERDEYFEVVDLLQTFAYQFSTAQRMQLRDLLASFALDSKTDTGRSWDTYMIFHQVFDLETRRDLRNATMTSFFERGRPDLATHVFMRMSRHVRGDTRPDVDTYVAALEGIALTREAEALEVIHNQLKLDTDVEPCTRLYNALMLAYTACDAPWRSLEFWDQIATSDEGPSYNSLHIALRACQRAPFGFRTAQTIWAKLEQTDVEINKDLFASYVGALAGNQMFDECTILIGRTEEATGSKVDAAM